MGIGKIHICAALTHGNEDYAQFGFDSGVEFPPHNLNTVSITEQIQFHEPFRGNVMAYHTVAQCYLERRYTYPNVFRGVFPSWDNTARTKNRALIMLNGTPSNYEFWLAETLRKTHEDFPNQERFVFINAWNEWAEGCHLEPDRKYQCQFLEATLRAKAGLTKLGKFTDTELPSLFSDQKRTLISDMLSVINYHFSAFLGKLAVWLKRHPRIRSFIKNVLSFMPKSNA